MKKLFFFSALMILLILLIPFVYGYFFKSHYLQEITTPQSGPIQVTTYKLGIFSSVIESTLKVESDKLRLTLRIKSIIHHGPFVYNRDKKKYQFANAYVETYIFLPEIISHYLAVQDPENGFLRIGSLVTNDSITIQHHLYIPPITLPNHATWDGLKADFTTSRQKNLLPSSITGSYTIGAITIPAAAKISALYGNISNRLQLPNIWQGTHTMNLPEFTLTFLNGLMASGNHVQIFANYGATDVQSYRFDEEITATKLILPTNFPIQKIDTLFFNITASNLSVSALQAYALYAQTHALTSATRDARMKLLVNIITPTTQLNSTLSLNTELGAARADVNLSSPFASTYAADMVNKLNTNLSCRFARPLVEKLFAYFYPQLDTKKILIEWEQLGILVPENDDYVVMLVKKDNLILLNNRDISTQYSILMHDAYETLHPEATTAPAATQASPAPPIKSSP